MSRSSDDAPTRIDGPSQTSGVTSADAVPDDEPADAELDTARGHDEVTRVASPAAERDPRDVLEDDGDTEPTADTEPEIADTSRGGPTARPTATGTADKATSLSITTLRETMESQDAERTRGFVGLAAFVCLVLSVTLVFVRGDPTSKWVFVVGIVLTGAMCGWLFFELRDPSAYELRHMLWAGYVAIACAFCGINFFGFYSPAPVVIPFGLYFFGLAHSFAGTLVIYLLCAITYAALAIPIGFGWIADRGLVTGPDLTKAEVVILVGAVELIFFATYAVARLSRRATENALHEHDRAIRAIAGRDALLQEARMDLEGVLRARGLGRFTDEMVGGYRLGEILGRGGMGEVYEALHVDSEEEVAVKLLHPHVLSDADAVRRFMRECKLVSKLDVPNVVKVFETSTDGELIPFIAMERLRGTDLSDYLRARGRMKMRDVLRLIREVGRGLDAARKEEIVHRDIKPRNLFFAERGAGQRPVWKILDFGVSKLGGEATITQHHIVGTPSYMAPEQAEGGEVTHRADLFSLGVIAYRALTGRPAFSADSPAAILYQVVNEMPPRPSELDRRLGEDVDLVLGIAIAKDPWDRFDSAEELADMLDKASKGRLPGAVRERAERVLDKHPWL